MLPQLVEIADVANVIALAHLIAVFPFHRSAGQFFHSQERFENRARIAASAADVIHFRTTRCGEEPLRKLGYIEGVDIVPNLFSLVAVNVIAAPRYMHSDQVT
jgi:hypothetical protein